MANILGSLLVELKANTGAFVQGMSTASYASRQAGKDIQSSFASLGNVAATALAPFGAIGAEISATLGMIGDYAGKASKQFADMGTGMSFLAVGAGATIGAFVAVEAGAIGIALHTAEAVAQMHEQAQAAGISITALSGLSFVAKEVGVDQQTMVSGLEKMSKAALLASEGSKTQKAAFDALGVSVTNNDGTFRDTTAIFEDLAARFAAMPDGVQKTALAMTVFGKAGAQLIPVLNQGRDGIQQMLDTATKLGIVLSDSDGRAAHEFEQSLTTLKAAGDGLEITLERDLLPTLQAVAKAFVDASSDKSGDFSLFISGVEILTKAFVTLGDTIFLVASSIGRFIGDALGELNEFALTVYQVGNRAIHLDWSGAEAAAQDGLTRMKGVLDTYLTDSEKSWDSYGKFVAGVWGQAINGTGFSAGEALLGNKAAPAIHSGNTTADLTAAAQAQADANAAAMATGAAAQKKLKDGADQLAIALKSVNDAFDKQLEKLGLMGPSLDHVSGNLDKLTYSQRQQVLAQVVANEGKEDAIRLNQLLTQDALAEEIDRETKSLNDFMKSADPLNDLPPLFVDIGSKLADGPSFPISDTTAKVEKLSRSWRQFGDAFSRDIADMVTGSRSFVQVLQDIEKQLVELIAKQAIFGSSGNGSGFFGFLGSIAGSLFGGPKLPTSGMGVGVLPTIALPGMAAGGDVSAGSSYVVGEDGPELFVPRSSGTIVPNGGGGGGANITYNIDARGAAPGVEQNIMQALKQTEDRAVIRSIAAQKQLALRTA